MRFFGESRGPNENWERQLQACRETTENVLSKRQTPANKEAVEVLQRLEEECAQILHPKGPSLGS